MEKITTWAEALAIIKSQMDLNGVTQVELAKNLEMHQPQLSRILSGKTHPSMDNAMRIMEKLNIQIGVYAS